MTNLTDEARTFYASLVGLPWQLLVGLAVLIVAAYVLARWTEGYDEYTDRPGYEPGRTCGEFDGDTFCRRPEGHAADFHSDGFGRTWPVGRAA